MRCARLSANGSTGQRGEKSLLPSLRRGLIRIIACVRTPTFYILASLAASVGVSRPLKTGTDDCPSDRAVTAWPGAAL